MFQPAECRFAAAVIDGVAGALEVQLVIFTQIQQEANRCFKFFAAKIISASSSFIMLVAPFVPPNRFRPTSLELGVRWASSVTERFLKTL